MKQVAKPVEAEDDYPLSPQTQECLHHLKRAWETFCKIKAYPEGSPEFTSQFHTAITSAKTAVLARSMAKHVDKYNARKAKGKA